MAKFENSKTQSAAFFPAGIAKEKQNKFYRVVAKFCIWIRMCPDG